MPEPLLDVKSLAGGYGAIDVLFDVDLRIEQGQVVALCGRNGMGKTSTIRAIMGALTHRAGTIHFAGQTLVGMPSHQIARLGVGLVPEGRQLFQSLSVRENLEVLARGSSGGWTMQRALDLFPQLGKMLERPAWQTSGGEQQMIAISRALMTNPKLLILDEATEGLAPLVRHQIWQTLHRLKTEGLALLVVDKNLRALSRIADFCYVLERGRTSWRGTGEQLAAERENVERMLTV
ncbi:ABC transporter ATP-binding protein [Pseudorhodoplanes sinuspersici]|uniref:ABC transporter ATP-binding protein n=1 Tax=Pseudorhodoplanes sinuspersici TaxID=1235591 RepID=UPI000A32798A|nr:ABC transporter ATP-binding protein [Pseudorhodoplanes sinuspersici]RKE68449.1 branched-chain amino acid transport system ATP-binding protein [Pseudorhodoplanes sinuspersici]